MKKSFGILIATFLCMGFVHGTESNLFSYDKNAVDLQLSEVTRLENALINGESPNTSLFQQIAISTKCNLGSMNSNNVFGIPSFFWGCCAGVPGIILVYVMTNDEAEARKAFMGFAVFIVIQIASYAYQIGMALGQY